MEKYRAAVPSWCKICGKRYHRGDWIVRLRVARFAHLDCALGDVR